MVDYDVRHEVSVSNVPGGGGAAESLQQLDFSGAFIRSFMRATLDYGGKGLESRTPPLASSTEYEYEHIGCFSLLVLNTVLYSNLH